MVDSGCFCRKPPATTLLLLALRRTASSGLFAVCLSSFSPLARRLPRSGGHGPLELESPVLTLTESQLALEALADLCAGSREPVEILMGLQRRAKTMG